MQFWLRLINYQTYHISVFYKMDPVFIKSAKNGRFYKYEYTNKTKNIHPWPKVQSICSRIEKERFQKELTQTWHSEPPPDCDSPTNQGKEVVSLGQTQIVYPDIQEFSESNILLLRAGLLVCHQVPVRKTCLLQRLDRLYQQVFRNFT